MTPPAKMEPMIPGSKIHAQKVLTYQLDWAGGHAAFVGDLIINLGVADTDEFVHGSARHAVGNH